MREVSIIVEEHDDGFVAYPVGLNGVVVAEGASVEDALKDIRSAIKFHIETFGASAFVANDLRSVSVRSLPIAA